MSKHNFGFIRLEELADLLQVSKSTIYRMEQKGVLPARTLISERTIGWQVSEIEEFIRSRNQA